MFPVHNSLSFITKNNENNTINRIRPNRFNSDKRRNLTNEFVNKFLTTNSHLKPEDVKENFISILKEEMSKEIGVRPATGDIMNAISDFYVFENLKTK